MSIHTRDSSWHVLGSTFPSTSVSMFLLFTTPYPEKHPKWPRKRKQLQPTRLTVTLTWYPLGMASDVRNIFIDFVVTIKILTSCLMFWYIRLAACWPVNAFIFFSLLCFIPCKRSFVLCPSLPPPQDEMCHDNSRQVPLNQMSGCYSIYFLYFRYSGKFRNGAAYFRVIIKSEGRRPKRKSNEWNKI